MSRLPFSQVLDTSLSAWLEAGAIGHFELHVVRRLARLAPDATEFALAACALASGARARGHACLDLAGAEFRAPLEALDARGLDAWLADLRTAAFVRAGDDERATPFVLDGHRLYVDRLFLAEGVVASAIERRVARRELPGEGRLAAIDAALRRLFAPTDGHYTDQMRAALVALTHPFAVITGGPGTGKTTTVVRILAATLEAEPSARVLLVAPTGKAAARLAESVRTQLASLASPARGAIPAEASTIHRALELGRTRAKSGDGRSELPADLVVVDEASMVDLELMATLLASLEDDARVLLLGDRDQLSSVDAGTVLGDVTGPREDAGRCSRAFASAVASVVTWPESRIADRARPPLADAVAVLETSRRFDPERGIGRLARAVHDGQTDRLAEALTSNEARRVDPDRDSTSALFGEILDHYTAAAHAPTAAEALTALDRLRVLCALREGPSGVAGWNRRIEAALVYRGVVPAGRAHYPGRPVLVTSNDYEVGLFNGDVGIERLHDGRLVVAFPDARAEGGVRLLSPTRLPAHETVYAMTIHKSQGTEVEHVVLVLPEAGSRVVGRELVYTGLTRARRRVTLVARLDTLAAAVARPVSRASGLGERLHGRG